MTKRAPATSQPERVALPDDAVLVLGAGLAGLFLALRLAPRPVVVVSSRPPGEAASSAWAQGGIAAALGPDDDPALHLADTVAAGGGLVDEAAARILCVEGPDLVRQLADTGAPFDRTADGGFALSLEGAHSRARVARVRGDRAGAAVIAAVTAAVRRQTSIQLAIGLRAVDLVRRDDGRVGGALCVDRSGRAIVYEAGETAMALGGAGALFAVTTNPPGARGDAIAMAARASAFIADPEFVQFHPTAIDVGRDPAPLATEALRGEGAVLVDRTGARLLEDDLAPRDRVARAVHRALLDGRGAFLDAAGAVGAAFPEHFPTVFAAAMSAGIDPRTEPMPVAPAAHYHMGGVATDPDGRASVAGLWAFGECASTGAHGANRLASNSLLEALVTPARAARVLKACEPAPRSPVTDVGAPPPRPPPNALARLRQSMSRHAGVERDAAGLEELGDQIDALERQHGGLNALLAARLIVTGALRRRESRGAHSRADYPLTSPQPRRTYLTLADDASIREAPAAMIPAASPAPQTV